MAKQTINIGASPNDGTGTPLRTSFDYCNLNFTELYTATGPSGNNIVVPGTATITGDLTVDTSTLKVDATNNYVGIGTASPVQSLTISGEASVRVGDLIYWNAYYNAGFKARAAGYAAYIGETVTGDFTIANTTASAAGAGSVLAFLTRYNIDKDGVATWQNVGGVAGTAMTLNSTGLAVGTASATYKLDLLSTSACQSRIRSTGNGQTVGLRIESKNSDGTDCQLLIGSGVVADNEYNIRDTLNTKNLYRISGISASSNSHLWFTGSATASMTLDASGNLLVGTTNTSATAGPGFKSQFSSTVPQFAIVVNEAGTSTSLSIYNVSAAAYRFYVNNGGTVFATNTTISAISDARLKENVQDIDVGLGAILALKPRKFDWKAGKGKDIKGDRGFIAQEFETVFPNLIDEWADPAPEGEAPYKSVRQDLIPVLVKAIQELTARVQTLEAK